jgi:hypothetical protein
MPNRALKLSLIATCALVACKPSPTPASDAASAASAGPPPAAAVDKPSTLARIAGELNPLADPKAAIRASMDRFMAVRSYHATMEFAGAPGGTGGPMSHHEIDFVATDRFRMQTPMGTQVIIGDTMYMHVQGRTMKVPMPKGTLTQWRDPARLAESEAGMTVQAQGRDTVDGVAALKYLVRHEQPSRRDDVDRRRRPAGADPGQQPDAGQERDQHDSLLALQ